MQRHRVKRRGGGTRGESPRWGATARPPPPPRLPTVPDRPPRPIRVLLAFTAVLALWALQPVLIVARVGESYPGILMPGFAGSGGYADGAVRIAWLEATFVGADGEAATLSARELLEGIPDSHHGILTQHVLAPAGGPERPRPARDRLRRAAFPGLATGRIERDEPCRLASLAAWARPRGAAALGAPPVRMELHGYVDTFHGGGGTSRREPAGVRIVPLAPGAVRCG
jgi:hypothetical protein